VQSGNSLLVAVEAQDEAEEEEGATTGEEEWD
jgi:hypothetical protein